MYDIAADDRRLRQTLDQPPEERGAAFSRLRKEYPRRREFSRFMLPASAVPAAYQAAVTTGLTARTPRSVEIFARRQPAE
jgi:erythronate-4-phosphate dehydrogenase